MKAFAITEVKRKGGQERQRLSRQSAHAGTHAAAERPAETQQKPRPSQSKNLNSSLSTESGSPRETFAAAGDLANKLQERLLDKVAGKWF
jgi:hypothetical protein